MQTIEPLIRRTHKAAADLRRASDRQIKAALKMLADSLEAQKAVLLRANAKDLERQDTGNPRNDRLMLNADRSRSIAGSSRKIGRLPDPSGKVLVKTTLRHGFLFEMIARPL